MLLQFTLLDQRECLLAPGQHLRAVCVVKVVLPVHGEPAVCLFCIGLYALAKLIHQSDLNLGNFVAPLCCHAIPAHRGDQVKGNAIGMMMDEGKVVGRIRVALVCPALPDGDGLTGFARSVQLRRQAQINVYGGGLCPECGE